VSSVMKEVTLSLAITISKLESDKLVLNKRIAELENVLQGVIDSCCLDEIDERVLVGVLAKGGAE
jgi:hypothetical protein